MDYFIHSLLPSGELHPRAPNRSTITGPFTQEDGSSMSAPATADAFLELVRKSQLIDPRRLQAAQDRLGLLRHRSAQGVARHMVKAGLLTSFQARRLLDGRHRGFFVKHYKVLEVIGAGGMGWLYLAEDTQKGEKVALKLLPTPPEDQRGVVARFEVEGRVGLKLQHPNIIRTLEVGRNGDVHYIVMEFVPGINLQEMIDLMGAIDPRHACDIACQTALGLQHAHEQGLVHRDIKPANLLIDREGTVRILDFGLAMLDREDYEFSLAMIFGQDCLGTADYAAPEQTRNSYEVGPAADIYSLGCTLYTMLTGRVPFPGNTVSEKMKAHQRLQPVSIRQLAPHVPEEVARVVRRMMAKDPKQRPQSAREVYRALIPFAKRKRTVFNYRAILKARVAEIHRRIAAIRRRQAQQETSTPNARRSRTTSILLIDPLSSQSQTWGSSTGVRTPSPETPQPQSTPPPQKVQIRHRHTGEVLLELEEDQLKEAPLRGARLAGADLQGLQLPLAKLSNADLQGARLEKANLTRAEMLNTWLTQADAAQVQLAGADLSGAQLNQAHLERANLVEAVLRNAKLVQAQLNGADLSRADMSMAELTGADLREAKLYQANLRGANLDGADLRGADLRGANLAGAHLLGAKLQGVIVEDTIGPDGQPFQPPDAPPPKKRSLWPRRR